MNFSFSSPTKWFNLFLLTFILTIHGTILLCFCGFGQMLNMVIFAIIGLAVVIFRTTDL